MLASSSTISMLGMERESRRFRRFRSDRHLRRNRQFDDKPGANRRVFLHTNGAAVILDDPAHDRKTKPSPSLLRRKIRQEQLLFGLVGNPMPRVRHNNFD